MPSQSKNRSILQFDELMSHYQGVPILDFKPTKERGEVVAIMGGSHLDGSFKNLLGAGVMKLAEETGVLKKGQPTIESSSGSMGEGLAVGGLMLGHDVTIVSDGELPEWTRTRIRALGSKLIIVSKPDPKTGWQGAREYKVLEIMKENPNLYWFDQNNNPLIPETFTRWLVPMLAKKINPLDFKAAAFCVGSGGHFSALSKWLKSVNPEIKTFAVDRVGSITFGGTSGPSTLRGFGNQIAIPKVIAAHMHLVDGIETVDEGQSYRSCRNLGKYGCFVGGSSGAAFLAASRIAARLGGPVLTLFPDRGDIYSTTIWDDEWMHSKGFMKKEREDGYKRA